MIIVFLPCCKYQKSEKVMNTNKNKRVILLLVFASFFINVYTFTSLSHLFRYIPNFEIIRRFDEIVTYSDLMFLKRFLLYFITSSISGIVVFYSHKKISKYDIEKSRKTIYITLIIITLTATSIALHLILIERYGWDFDVTYKEYIFRRIMWYIGRTVSISIIALYMAYFAIRRDKEMELELEIHNLKISNIKNKYLVLKEQLNPNFLFNAVNTLNKLIFNDPAGAKEFLNALSKLLRNSVSQAEINSVEKEIEIIDSLVIIYRYETDKGFVVQNHITPEIYQKEIPTLIISNIISFAHKRHLTYYQTGLSRIILRCSNNSIYIEIESTNIATETDIIILCKQLSERYYTLKKNYINIQSSINRIELILPL